MPQPGPESIWLWIGTALMALGTLAFIGMGWNETDEQKQEFYIITIFIPAIAAVSYFSMAMGYGLTEVTVAGEMLDIYWARYADWLFTTPLLLIDLALLAGADRNTIATLVGLDVGMIITGLVAALTTASQAMRIAWWGISCGFFLVLLYILVSRLTAQASEMPGDVGNLFGTLRNVVILLWLAYPVVWIVGTEGLGLVPLYYETAAFMVLDVLAKVGFGFLLLRSRGVLDQATSSTAEPEAAAAD
ncbi:bacteriorhodopsin [Halorientalis regularis]|jgi:bacteriorhodopsin|uniref:Bacteriorhodopsin n=1 Tax=Halorientalis regularis TaxID=660518 RepID=A0A1G7PUC9_9EURY|nr:bacteriorhodopsin [Halorientalis regularis]SDF89813.1 bacteriorhodopsin [Halorientalis regularis]